MNITPTQQKHNALLGRTEVEAQITFEQVTPKNTDVLPLIAQICKADEKNVVIKHIYSDFGSRQADVVAYVYDSETARATYEQKPKVKKAKTEEAKK